MEQQITVTVLSGHGEKRVRMAVDRGLIREDIADDMREVLAELEKVRRENRDLRMRLSFKTQEVQGYRSVYYRSLVAEQENRERKSRKQTTRALALLGGCVFVFTLLCTLICNLIFG